MGCLQVLTQVACIHVNEGVMQRAKKAAQKNSSRAA
jgi:hypothetical protein